MRAARGTLTEPGKDSPFRERERRGKPRSVPPHARRRISQRRARAARQDRHGRRAISICAIRCSTASCMPSTRAPAKPGASIRATISPTASPTPSRASPIRSARWNSRIIGRSTTGSWQTCRCRRIRISTNSRGSISTHTVLSKRVLTELVRGGYVGGWDDPRMPTLAGLRRRGVPPEAIRDFVKRIGVAKANSVVDMAHARFFHPRAAEQDRRAPHGGAAAAQSRDRELSGRPERGARSAQPSGQSGGRHAAPALFAASFTSSATISWRTRRRNSSGCRPAPRCGCATPISSPAARW